MTACVLPPTTYRKRLKAWTEAMAELRTDVARARRLLRSPYPLDREDGQGILDMSYHTHRDLQRRLRELRACTVEKYAHVSPAAAERLRRRGGR